MPREESGFTHQDRLGLSLFAASLAHMVVILGLTFSMPAPSESRLNNLEITLVQGRSDQAPADAQLLAQANQDGGGDTDREDVAQSPLAVHELSERDDRLPVARPQTQTAVPPADTKEALLTQAQAAKKVRAIEAQRPPREARTEAPNPGLRPDLAQERAYLTAEISRAWQEYQKRPRRTFLNARTREHKYAAYMDAWRAKVERIGNLKYPPEAKRRKLHGRVMLDVAISANGSVESVSVRRSSGHRLLDDWALRSVELAAPYAPFPQEIRAETDILHITRTWRFNENNLTTHAQ